MLQGHAKWEVTEMLLNREMQEQNIGNETKESSIEAQLLKPCYRDEDQDESAGVDVQEGPDKRKDESVGTKVQDECIKRQDNFIVGEVRKVFIQQEPEGREEINEICQTKQSNTNEANFSQLRETVDLVKKDVNNCIDGVQKLLMELKTDYDPFIEPSYERHEISSENTDDDLISILLRCQEYARRNNNKLDALLKECEYNIWDCREQLD